MTDLEPILALWRDLEASGTEYVLGTVIEVEGSGYRKPGARMLIAADGRRTGTISGGCLEAEVARKAFWHTEDGPAMRRYSTSTEDGDAPYGMGCGGVVHLLLERRETAHGLMARLAESFAARRPMAIATVLEGPWIGERGFWPETKVSARESGDQLRERLNRAARRGFEERRSFAQAAALPDDESAKVRVEWVQGRPGLFVFGAGDDAIPMVGQAHQLGWHVAVADGRSNLATRARFPEAGEVRVLDADEPLLLDCRSTDAAVVMTHSLEQDTRILRALLDEDLSYIGVLGPVQRTRKILTALAGESDPDDIEEQIEGWLKRLNAPMGLDLGGETPADIALAVMAEIQRNRNGGSGEPLKMVRARNGEWAIRAVMPSGD